MGDCHLLSEQAFHEGGRSLGNVGEHIDDDDDDGEHIDDNDGGSSSSSSIHSARARAGGLSDGAGNARLFSFQFGQVTSAKSRRKTEDLFM
jgi:hypothetical protein